MKIIIILNLSLICLGFYILVIKPYVSKISIQLDRTFWKKKTYGFHITKWENKRNICPNHGVVIFTFNWKNPENIRDDMNKK